MSSPCFIALTCDKTLSQLKNQANMPLTAVQHSTYNQHRLGLRLYPLKTKQGATTTGLKTRSKRTRAQREMEQRGPPRHCENCVRKTRWSRQSPHDMLLAHHMLLAHDVFLTVTRTRAPMMCEGCDNEAAHTIRQGRRLPSWYKCKMNTFYCRSCRAIKIIVETHSTKNYCQNSP